MDLADPDLSVVFCDDATIRELNATWRDEDQATDVLSFPLHEPDAFNTRVSELGDIVISVEYAERLVAQESHRERVAAALGKPIGEVEWGLNEEVSFLVIHGILHLVGYDHMEPEEEEEMKRQERRLWEAS